MPTISKNFQPYLAYSASAGSGKTFALSVRYISLLFMGVAPSSILAATFTNKAAAQMRQRVLESLKNLGDEEHRAFEDAILSQTGLSRTALLEKKAEVVALFLKSRSFIVTLDSFFASILRSASLQLGIEPDFVMKDLSLQKLESYFLEEVKRASALSVLVRLAMDVEDKRLSKIFDLMQNFYKVDPLLPHIKKSDHNLSIIEEAIEAQRVAMIQALHDAKAPARCIKQFEVTTTKALFAKALFAKASLGEHSWFKKITNAQIEMLYASMKELLAEWSRVREAIVLSHLFELYDSYKNATITHLRSSGILSFDDLSYMAYRLLYESITKEFLYFKIDSQFEHILLDEFQDTSTLQFLLLKPLIDEIFAGKGQSEFKSFFYVGDTKQSLYRFRGGVEELFERVSQGYGVTIENMDTNYRSSRFIVEQVNRWFVGKLTEYIPQKSREGVDDGYVLVLESELLVDEAIKQVKHLIELGVDSSDIALLVSTNKDGLTLQEACEAVGIETILQTTSSLKYHPKIASLIAMVKYLFYQEPEAFEVSVDAQALLSQLNSSYAKSDFSWFQPSMEPVALLDRLIRDFGYFDEDINILKLLEFAASFHDIPTLLEEFENSSISVASRSQSGVKILTIHGSKGLEFPHVIVVDKFTRKNSDRSALIYHYNDTLSIDQILYRTAKRENFDSNYAQIMEHKKALATKDHKNVLYVALTRAIYGLTVIKKEKESIFDDIEMQAIALGRVGQRASRLSSTNTSVAPTIKLSNYGRQEVVSSSDRDESKDWDAIIFGTALHYLLEMLHSFDKESLEQAMVALRNRYGQLLAQQQITDIYQRVLRLINHTEFQTLVQNAKITVEQSISFAGELKQIDLLLEYSDHSLIIDYKSSLKYESSHTKQVRLYQKAIESISQKATKGMIIYLLEGEILLKSLK